MNSNSPSRQTGGIGKLTPERGTASAALPYNLRLSRNLIAFRGASLAGFATGLAFGDLWEFFAFLLAVPADHRDCLGEMAGML